MFKLHPATDQSRRYQLFSGYCGTFPEFISQLLIISPANRTRFSLQNRLYYIGFRDMTKIHWPLNNFYLYRIVGGADWDRSIDISWVVNKIKTESISSFSKIICWNSVNNDNNNKTINFFSTQFIYNKVKKWDIQHHLMSSKLFHSYPNGRENSSNTIF